MPSCYFCSAHIRLGGGNRRWVPVSRGQFLSEGRSGLRIGFGASQGLRTICNACAIGMQGQAAALGKLLRTIAVVVAIVVVALFFLGWMHG
jgi:hypothetical protein